MPREFRGIAALENYTGSVDGGGHELFYGNNEEETFNIVENALVGCEVLGLTEHSAIASKFLEAMDVDADRKDAFERGEAQHVRPKLESLDTQIYSIRISDADAMAAVARIPDQYRDDVADILSKPDLYSRNPFAIEGMVWILNHPRLKWHSGPGYWDAVEDLVRAVKAS